jgi:hypothetical protein
MAELIQSLWINLSHKDHFTGTIAFFFFNDIVSDGIHLLKDANPSLKLSTQTTFGMTREAGILTYFLCSASFQLTCRLQK